MTVPVRHRLASLATMTAAAACPLPALAQAAQSLELPATSWHYGLTLYVYVPSVGGKSSVPADTNGTTLDITGEQILDALEMAFMASFDAHNGRWGVFSDVVYMDFSAGRQGTRDFSIGNAGLPASTSANLDYGLTGFVTTVAGQYRVASEPAKTIDLLGGVRYLNIKQSLSWDIDGSLGPLDPAARSGHSDTRLEQWDVIAGVKGRAWLDPDRKWSLPFYADIGTGETRFTWQVAAGATYAFGWGEVTGMWRYLGYEMKPGSAITKLNFNGPMLGATFRW